MYINANQHHGPESQFHPVLVLSLNRGEAATVSLSRVITHHHEVMPIITMITSSSQISMGIIDPLIF